MRNPFSPRAFVFLAIALLLASALPPTAAQVEQLYDIRITSVRAITKGGTVAGIPSATYGWFPEVDRAIQFEVTLQVFQSPQSPTPVAFNGPVRVLASHPTLGTDNFEVGLFGINGCYGGERYEIPVTGKKVLIGYVTRGISGLQTYTFETNKRCEDSRETFTPCCQPGDNAENNKKSITLGIGLMPDFALVPRLCASDAACSGGDRKGGGPGVAVDPAGVSAPVAKPAIQICDHEPRTRFPADETCTPPTLTITSGDREIYFRTAVSALLHGATGWPRVTDSVADLAGATAVEPASGGNTEHANERYLTYPHGTGVDTVPILVPVKFELYKVRSTGASGGDEYTRIAWLPLADDRGDAVAPNCPDGLRRCAQWISTDTGGHPTYADTFSPVATTEFNFKELGGDFQFRAYLNGVEPENATLGCGVPTSDRTVAPDSDCTNNVATYDFHIKAPDLVVDIIESDVRTTAYGTNDFLSFNGTITNRGDLAMDRAFGSTGNTVNVRFLIDERSYVTPKFCNPADPTQCSTELYKDALVASGSVPFRVDMPMNGAGCTDENCLNFVPPGTRTARIVVDANDALRESEEDNNEAAVTFLLKDTEAPKLAGIRLFNTRGDEIKSATPEIARGAPFNVTTVITDTDHSITDVKVKFLRPNGEEYVCPCAQLNQSSRTTNDMWFTTTVAKGLTDLGEWTVTVTASDPSGGVATPVAKKVKVIAFKKVAQFDHTPIVVTPPSPGSQPLEARGFPANGTVLDYRGAGVDYKIVPEWTLPDDPRDQHGFLPAWTSQGMRIRFERPDHNWSDITVENDNVIVVKSRFGGVVTRLGMGNNGVPGPFNFTKIAANAFTTDNCVTGTDCKRRIGDTKFGLPFNMDAEAIGRYNVTLNLTDVGGASKEYLTTFEIRDARPFANMTLRRVTTGANPNPDEGQVLKPAQSVRYRVTGHDDQGFEPDGTIHLNFTHIADANFTVDKWVNVSMGKPVNCPTRVGAFQDCLFEKRVKTGRSADGAQLTLAGRWNVTVWSEDKYHNFGKNTTTFYRPATGTTPEDKGSPLVVFLNDTVAADFNGTGAYGTVHAEEEVGGTVQFYARVADDLDPKVFLEVKEGSQIFADFVKMDGPDRYGNFTYNMTFDAAHTLEYRFKVVDSNATRVPKFSESRTVSIHENLPPRVDVLLANVPDHGYFAKAAPVLEFKVYDTAQGVNSATIQMMVDGENVTTLEKTLVDNGHGFLVRYTRDPARPWVHGQKVNFSLEAKDLSVPPKTVSINGTFTVDAIAPKSRIVTFEPRYVAKENDLWNVSLTTAFTPASSDDEDGLPTGVAEGGIKYQFIRSGPGKEFTYNGTPFPMSDLPAAQNVGNAEYFVRVLGTDIVGNKEIGSTSNTLRVFLDQVPPELVRSKLKTTGRVVNATFDDPAAGTKAARIHYRYDSGAWASIDMVKGGDGTWTATIPANAQAKTVSYYLEATDNVGNRKQFGDEQSPPWSFPIGNRPPSITITAPANGQTVSGSVTLRWEASDPDGDPLTYRVYYKPTAGRDELELTTLSAGTQSYVLNTATLGKDGQYDIRVTASDGNFFEESTVRVDVLNAKAVFEPPVPDKPVVAPGEIQCIRTRVSKSNVAVVEATVYFDGDKVATVPLADNGQGCDIRAGDGIYGGAFTPEESGSYDVEIYARYIEAGEPKESRSREDGLFEVKLSAVDVIGRNPVLFGAFVTLAVAVFAVGGFAVYRRWK